MEIKQVGSVWGIWDLQIQTIIDGGYIELEKYYEVLKASDEKKWDAFTALVGSEQDALLFDSRQYFHQGSPSVRNRCDSYSKNLFSFLKIYRPDLRCIGVTDHNYLHPELLDSLVKTCEGFPCKVLPGVEINVEGIHLLIYFPHPPCGKATFSEGIKAFLATIEIHSEKTGGVLSLAQGSTKDVIDKVKKQHGIFVFAHCNSSNGLFQERGKTDRTHLAGLFNHSSPAILQTHSKLGADELTKYILSNSALQQNFIMTIASDGRSLRDFGSPDESGHFCFVKGKTTVEGLRQASYEPEARILIGKSAPVSPIHRIDKISMNFPMNSKLHQDQFCLSGPYEVALSPNYTCFIGGRGTGKSTLLNLIQEKITPKSNSFFSDNRLTSAEGKVLAVSDHAKIDDDRDRKTVDFLSQNEIEKFATDAPALTAALYSRLEKENHGKLKVASDSLSGKISEFEAHIDDHGQLSDLKFEIEELQREQQSQEKILISFQSEEYKALSTLVGASSEKLRAFQNSKIKFNRLSSDVSKLIPQVESQPGSNKTSNEYEVAYEKMVALLKQATALTATLNLNFVDSIEKSLDADLRSQKNNLSSYLAEKGLKVESQQDVANANEKIGELKNQILESTNKKNALAARISSYSPKGLTDAKAIYQNTLLDQIKSINTGLENLSTQVKAIKLELRFDTEAAKKAIFENFKETFSLNPSQLGTKENALYDALFTIEPEEIDRKEIYLAALEPKPKVRELSKSQTILIDLFQHDQNFELYKMLIRLNFSNVFKFKIFNVYYDGKLLSESSFGQRCTAAVVLLLLLGNHPIIIDEPEGHLDSLLIANYLVELIKKTKRHRQIIFATHNANLVVNGDADLIYHLEMTDEKRSSLTAVVLEDPEHRHRIISLEGGHEAFNKRENKYRNRTAGT